MASTVNERLLDIMVRHSVELHRHGNSLAAEIVDILNSADAALLEKLAARLVAIEERGFDLGPATTKRLERLIADLRSINEGVYKKVGKHLANELGELAAQEADFHAQALRSALPIEIATTVPAPALLRTLATTAPLMGAPLADWVAGQEAGRLDRLNRAIRDSIVNGDTTDEIVRKIRGSRKSGYSDGILHVSRRSAQQLARTATNHVSNVARQQTWASSSVVKGWVFHAVMDMRTSTPCAARSGNIYPVGEGPIPPQHRNCRSQAIPITKSYRELGLNKDEIDPGTQATMDGQVPGDITFAQWLKKKGNTAQDTILGPTRAKWFREGKLTLSDLVKGDGTQLTLEQLRKRYSDLLG